MHACCLNVYMLRLSYAHSSVKINILVRQYLCAEVGLNFRPVSFQLTIHMTQIFQV